MARFVTTEDFETGKLKIATNQYSLPDLQACIDEVEPRILKSMLGCALYDLFIADWDAVVVNEFSEARFKAIYNLICIDDDCGILESDGIKQMIMYFVYFYYVRDQGIQNRETGNIRAKNENSDNLSNAQAGLCVKYNKGIDTYHGIQRYICVNPESYDYTDYNGQKKEKLSWI